MLSPHIFSHFYSVRVQQSIAEVMTWSQRVGSNPIFVFDDQADIYLGYVSPSTLQKNEGGRSLRDIVQHCPILRSETLHLDLQSYDNYDVFLVADTQGICGWCDRNSLSSSFEPAAPPATWQEQLSRFSPWLAHIARAAAETNCRISLVGGAVRDILSHKEALDLDFLVQGSVYALVDLLVKRFQGSCTKEALFEAAHWTTPDECTFDFTVARQEWYASPAELPQTQHGTLRDDILRRDFSINALVLRVHPDGRGDIIDAVNGIQDLQQKKVRVLHKQSFQDDPTRIFRAARYAGRYHLTLSPQTRHLMEQSLAERSLFLLSQPRLGKELQRIFEEANPVSCWQNLIDWSVIAHLFPTSAIELDPVWKIWKQHNSERLPISFSRLCWLHIAHTLSSSQDWIELIAPIKGGKKLWTEHAAKLRGKREQLSRSQSKADWGEVFDKSISELSVYLSLWYPKAVSWWFEHGQHQKTPLTGYTLIQAGCPRGPLIRKALLAAQRSAWLGESESIQNQKAFRVWNSSAQ